MAFKRKRMRSRPHLPLVPRRSRTLESAEVAVRNALCCLYKHRVYGPPASRPGRKCSIGPPVEA